MSDQLQPEALKNILEAALLVADSALTIDRFISLFPDEARPHRDDVKKALAELEKDYAGRGIVLRKISRGYRFQSEPRYSPWLEKLWEEKPRKYSRALLETLAIIAYRQPVTRADIEEIRGVAVSSEIIKTLLNREWVKIVGHRDVPGKPALLGTTNGFLEHFNLSSLSGLPPLSEIRDVETIAMELNYTLDEKNTDEQAKQTGEPESVEIHAGNEKEANQEAPDEKYVPEEIGGDESTHPDQSDPVQSFDRET